MDNLLNAPPRLAGAVSRAYRAGDVICAQGAPAGVYQVKALRKDKDAISAEVTISASSVKAEEKRMPSAEAEPVARNKSPLELGGIAALIAISAVLGFVLIRVR